MVIKAESADITLTSLSILLSSRDKKYPELYYLKNCHKSRKRRHHSHFSINTVIKSCKQCVLRSTTLDRSPILTSITACENTRFSRVCRPCSHNLINTNCV